ncbi:MAG: zinc-binding dehydrogenase [Candidatus Marinimicrobia bacterium]|jgi:NADPH:quinone reductase-like Zn-dependent oxidoreductase|nr:zinc-binding dehydrogenase [Candidatus Neomarinimicrobiota bacterium]MBT5404822.1 zinc-binding dehydrogenase [Candidatus Neomarinimicrobiota bacterium]MBT6159522.1 zinc-binding dehydrogenase [Candidatus Neomarinimicrobiota bacterium]
MKFDETILRLLYFQLMKNNNIYISEVMKHGRPNVLKYHECTLSSLKANELQIQVHYSGINFADILGRMGLYPSAPKPPYVPGFEISGKVMAAENDSHSHWIGKSVMAMTRFNGYSSVLNIPENQVFEIEESFLKQGAAIPVNYLTAYFMMTKQANLQKNEWILIHGIGGGVGIAALQLAKFLGANIIGTASKQKHERLQGMGIEHLIDYQREDFYEQVMNITDGKGADVILDSLGGKALKKSYDSLGEFGRLVTYGFSQVASGNKKNWLKIIPEYLGMPKFNPMKLMMENKGVFGFHLGMLSQRQDLIQEISRHLIQWLSDGRISPVVDKVFPLSEAKEAHQYIADRKNFGKILLSPIFDNSK